MPSDPLRSCPWGLARLPISLSPGNVEEHLRTIPVDPCWVLRLGKTMGSKRTLLTLHRPIVGGYLNKGLGWRSIFWCLAILSFSLWTAIFFFLPETWRPPVMSSEPTSKEKQPDPEQPIKKSRVMNPLKALGLLFYPNIALVIAYVAIL